MTFITAFLYLIHIMKSKASLQGHLIQGVIMVPGSKLMSQQKDVPYFMAKKYQNYYFKGDNEICYESSGMSAAKWITACPMSVICGLFTCQCI